MRNAQLSVWIHQTDGWATLDFIHLQYTILRSKAYM